MSPIESKAIMFLSVIVYAQRVDVVETTGVFVKSSYPSMATKVMFSDAKTVIKEFTNMMKGYNPETLTAKKNLITIDNVIIPAISENPIDVFANISQSKGSSDVNVVVASFPLYLIIKLNFPLIVPSLLIVILFVE